MIYFYRLYTKRLKKGTNFSEMKYECFEKIRFIRNYKVTAIKIYKDALTDQKESRICAFFRF